MAAGFATPRQCRRGVIMTRFAVPGLVALVAPLLTACPGATPSQQAEIKQIQDQVPQARPYAIDTRSMAATYKKIKDTDEGKARPRMIGVVLSVLPPGDPNVATMISENNLPDVPGAGVAVVYTPHGWSAMLVRSGTTIPEQQVVEFTYPAASDFSDLDDQAKVKATLADLQRDGSVGIQAVRGDCSGDTLGQGPFSLSCKGRPAEFVVNAERFTQPTLDWLNNPSQSTQN
jgi:hypothetical protein